MSREHAGCCKTFQTRFITMSFVAGAVCGPALSLSNFVEHSPLSALNHWILPRDVISFRGRIHYLPNRWFTVVGSDDKYFDPTTCSIFFLNKL